MGIPAVIKRSLVAQFTLCFLYVTSGLIVISLQLLTLVLWPINKTLYRIVSCKLVYLHWAELVFLCDYWAEVELHTHVDPRVWEFTGKEHALLVLNHRNSLDFMITWMLGHQFGVLGSCKCVVMDWLKYIPFLGWSFVLLEFIFISKDQTKNRDNVTRGFKTYGSYPLNCVTLLFCEGSRFSEYDREKCRQYAQKHGLQPLRHLLLPRTKGFTMAIDGLKGSVPAMYDCCIGYDSVRGAKPTLENLLQGKKMVFHLTGRRVLIDDIPNATEKECADYCYEMYRKKDDEYDYFKKNNTFDGYDPTRKHEILPRKQSCLFVVIFWALVIGLPSLVYVGKVLFYGSIETRACVVLAVISVQVLLQVFVWFSKRQLPKKANVLSKKSSEAHNAGST